MRQRRVRRALAHERGRDVQVVVVEEDSGVGLPLELGDHRVGKGLVDLDVALRPGMVQAVIDVGSDASPQRWCWMNQSIGLATTL